MVLSRKKLLALAIISFSISLISCGVKGPPEAPYPTEATVKKDVPAAGATPAPVPFATPKEAPKKPATTKKKKKSQ